MKIFNTTPFSAVKIDKTKYAVTTTSYGTYRIGDKSNEFHKFSNNEVFIIDAEFIDQIYRREVNTSIVSYTLNNKVISIEEYTNLVKTLHYDCGFFDENSEVFVFFTMEQRQAWTDFQANVIPNRIEAVVFNPVCVIKICDDLPVITEKFILPMRKVSGNLFDTLYQLDINGVVRDFIRNTLADFGYTELEGEQGFLPPKTFFFKNGNIEFAQLANPVDDSKQYLTIFAPRLKQYESLRRATVGTFEECLAIKNQTIADLKLGFSAKLDTLTKMRDNPILLAEVITRIEKISDLLVPLEVKTSNSTKKRQIITQISELLQKLNQSISTKETHESN